ncbi:transcriptional activator NhaR [Pseudothauera nasutitermitis]|uniref:Transcriptional activator NhaR n=1 Tax=Pseudothauera nasutitermitis TaxID=2565930 RepID=A0A4S4AR87_9RHOO|nr:transcriptional activator NhaR [Pseudothauera nasutitermitis]THF61839.1 transcriptional activator NhaR [Pseudothauera nasutitermitis]
MLNFKQLHHFWNVARAGGIVRASERSGLAPQTLSGQIAALEASLGITLFRRQGRRLALTETGQMVLAYAEEIFRVGSELEEALNSRSAGRVVPFRVGVADVVPKAIAWLLLAPSMALPEPMRIVCREDKLERLLGELAIHKLDVVLADSPLPSHMDVRGYSHKLAESPVSLFAAEPLAATLGERFPASLDRAPLLLPGAEAAVRAPLLRWLEEHRIRPRIVGEFDDSALMKAFGEAGAGVFPAPTLIAEQVCRQHGVRCIGEASPVIDAFYAISVERRLIHPAIRAISREHGTGTRTPHPPQDAAPRETPADDGPAPPAASARRVARTRKRTRGEPTG